jgi:hypothetical protein
MIPLSARIEAAWLAVIPLAGAVAYVASGGPNAGWLYLTGWIPLAVSTAFQPRLALAGVLPARGRISALISALIVGWRSADAPQAVTRFLVEQATLDVGCLMLALAGLMVAKNLTDRSLGALPTFVSAILVASSAAMLIPVLQIGAGFDASFGLAFLTAIGAKASMVADVRDDHERPAARVAEAVQSSDDDAFYILAGLGLWAFGLPIVAALFHPDGLCGIGNCSSS